MAHSMICEIVAPDQMLYSGEVEFVSAPASEGEIGFMFLCAPFMSTLRQGVIRLRETDSSGDPRCFAVAGGYVEADGRKVVVLASRAIDVAQIDTSISSDRIAANQARLAELSDDDSRATFVRQEIEWQQHLIKVKSAN